MYFLYTDNTTNAGYFAWANFRSSTMTFPSRSTISFVKFLGVAAGSLASFSIVAVLVDGWPVFVQAIVGQCILL